MLDRCRPGTTAGRGLLALESRPKSKPTLEAVAIRHNQLKYDHVLVP